MSKPVIAVDIDDVLAAHAEAFIAYTNRKWGTNLKVEDYHEHWEDIWGVDLEEVERRSAEYHLTHEYRAYKHRHEALPVLQKLKKDYRLIVVTSRRREALQDTLDWLGEFFDGIFEDVHFGGFWDKIHDQSVHLTKLDICREIGASYLIDDQLKHCEAVAGAGMRAVLFGNYRWNQADKLPERVTRCNDWAAVGTYFARQSA